MIADLVARLPGIPHSFLEIGCGDGSENNTRLLHEHGWRGFWIDRDYENIQKAKQVNAYVDWSVVTMERFPTPEQFSTTRFLYENGLGVLSIDVDGNDYWLWKRAIELGWRPWIVVIEAQIQKPLDQPYVMPYDANWVWRDDPEKEGYDFGASVYSLIELGKELGYRYVGKPENSHCPNLFFLRADLGLADSGRSDARSSST